MDVLGTLDIQVLRVATLTTSLTMEKKFWLQRQKDFIIQPVTEEVGTKEAKQNSIGGGFATTDFFNDTNNLEWKHQQQ